MKNKYAYFLIDQLASESDDFEVIGDDHPFQFIFSGKKYSIHLSMFGKAKRSDTDEGRIRVTAKTLAKNLKNKQLGFTTCYMGFLKNSKGDFFYAGPPDAIERSSANTIASTYGRFSGFKKAESSNIFTYFYEAENLNQEVKSIILPIRFLGAYLQNVAFFHYNPKSLSQEDQISDAIKVLKDISMQAPSTHQHKIKKSVQIRNKKKFVYQITKYPRDPKFAKNVKEAYGYKCAICSLQLDIVEAAHIVPHGHAQGSDDVDNGIALCPKHHKLYDKSILIIDENQKIIINENKVKHLKSIGRINGLVELRQEIKNGYNLPRKISDHPKHGNIILGKKIRLI